MKWGSADLMSPTLQSLKRGNVWRTYRRAGLAWSSCTSATEVEFVPVNRSAGTPCLAGAQCWLEDHSSGDDPTRPSVINGPCLQHVQHTTFPACSRKAATVDTSMQNDVLRLFGTYFYRLKTKGVQFYQQTGNSAQLCQRHQ